MIDPFKSALNKLKCPLCKAQIDIISEKNGGYGCASNIDHYQVTLSYSDVAIIWERLSFYDKKHKYIIHKNYSDLKIKTEIFIYSVDLEGRQIFTFDTKTLSIDSDAFDFNNFVAENAINRINTMLVFQ